ncbi:MAG: small multi-drug export protein [Clostridiales bacterium]|nr:small multi-drug export protein [Clostridiales bacterium]
MTEWIIAFGESVTIGVQKLLVVIVSMLPVIELKGTIPIAIAWGIPKLTSFVFAYIGSCLPVIPLLLLLRPIIKWMYTKTVFKGFANWIETRSEHRGQLIYDYRYFGLFLFVAIPLPTTGVWTGSIVASLLKMDIKKCIPLIFAGNLVAGIIVVLLHDYMWYIIIGVLSITLLLFILRKIKNKLKSRLEK